MKRKRIRICIIMTLAYPLFNSSSDVVFGGAEIDMYNLAVRLSKNENYEIIFLTGDYGQPYEEIYGTVKVRKIKYLGDSNKNSVYNKIVRQLSIWKELFKARANVYITETACEMLAWTVLIGKKLIGAKVIHRLSSDADTNLSLRKKQGFKFYKLYIFGLKSADLLISQTENQKVLLMKSTGLESKVIRNGFFINNYVDFNEKKHILWVSRALPIKRPELLIELAKRLPEENFIIIMPVNKENDREMLLKLTCIRDMISDASLNMPNLKYIDYVPFNKIQKYYNEAKLFVNTSEYEGFPNAFIQSCLGKTPILSFRVNPDNFINNFNVGFVCDDNLEKAVAFIKNLNGNKIENYGNNAYAYLEKYHNLEKIIHEYEHAISEILRN